MRRILLAIALLVVALLALCALVLGVLVWQNQNALMKSIDELKQEVGNKPAPPAPPTGGTNPGGSTSGTNPGTTPPTASCVGENEIISVNTPDARCCSGLVEVDADAGDLLKGITARCIGL